ncbi:Uncharacterised protein [uncultured archaeon]|nr:Uncharacterised protein [uncultured archaeon]
MKRAIFAMSILVALLVMAGCAQNPASPPAGNNTVYAAGGYNPNAGPLGQSAPPSDYGAGGQGAPAGGAGGASGGYGAGAGSGGSGGTGPQVISYANRRCIFNSSSLSTEYLFRDVSHFKMITYYNGQLTTTSWQEGDKTYVLMPGMPSGGVSTSPSQFLSEGLPQDASAMGMSLTCEDYAVTDQDLARPTNIQFINTDN